MITFAQLLRNYRCRKGLTQRVVAAKAGIKQGYITLLETGKRRNPSPEVLKQLTNVFQLSKSERQEFFLSAQRLAPVKVAKTRGNSPVHEVLNELLAIPPGKDKIRKYKQLQAQLSAILSSQGISKEEKKHVRLYSLLTEGYMYTPPERKGAKRNAPKQKPLPQSLRDEVRLGDKLRFILETLLDSKIHVTRRHTMANEVVSLLKWRLHDLEEKGVVKK